MLVLALALAPAHASLLSITPPLTKLEPIRSDVICPTCWTSRDTVIEEPDGTIKPPPPILRMIGLDVGDPAWTMTLTVNLAGYALDVVVVTPPGPDLSAMALYAEADLDGDGRNEALGGTLTTSSESTSNLVLGLWDETWEGAFRGWMQAEVREQAWGVASNPVTGWTLYDVVTYDSAENMVNFVSEVPLSFAMRTGPLTFGSDLGTIATNWWNYDDGDVVAGTWSQASASGGVSGRVDYTWWQDSSGYSSYNYRSAWAVPGYLEAWEAQSTDVDYHQTWTYGYPVGAWQWTWAYTEATGWITDGWLWNAEILTGEVADLPTFETPLDRTAAAFLSMW